MENRINEVKAMEMNDSAKKYYIEQMKKLLSQRLGDGPYCPKIHAEVKDIMSLHLDRRSSEAAKDISYQSIRVAAADITDLAVEKWKAEKPKNGWDVESLGLSPDLLGSLREAYEHQRQLAEEKAEAFGKVVRKYLLNSPQEARNEAKRYAKSLIDNIDENFTSKADKDAIVKHTEQIISEVEEVMRLSEMFGSKANLADYPLDKKTETLVGTIGEIKKLIREGQVGQVRERINRQAKWFAEWEGRGVALQLLREATISKTAESDEKPPKRDKDADPLWDF